MRGICVHKASDTRAYLIYTHAYGMSLHAYDGMKILHFFSVIVSQALCSIMYVIVFLTILQER